MVFEACDQVIAAVISVKLYFSSEYSHNMWLHWVFFNLRQLSSLHLLYNVVIQLSLLKSQLKLSGDTSLE